MITGELEPQGYGVPESFTPLDTHPSLITRIPGYLSPGTYKSSSIRDSAGGLTATAAVWVVFLWTLRDVVLITRQRARRRRCCY